MTAPITANTHTVHDGMVMATAAVPAAYYLYWRRRALEQRALLAAQAVALENLRDDLRVARDEIAALKTRLHLYEVPTNGTYIWSHTEG